MDTFIYVAGVTAVVALVFAVMRYGSIMKKDAGDERMQGISKKVQEGAAAFLRAEYSWLAVFVVIVAGAIAASGSDNGLGPNTAIAFVAGAIASGIAGYFGINPPDYVAAVVAFAFGLAASSFFR